MTVARSGRLFRPGSNKGFNGGGMNDNPPGRVEIRTRIEEGQKSSVAHFRAIWLRGRQLKGSLRIEQIFGVSKDCVRASG